MLKSLYVTKSSSQQTVQRSLLHNLLMENHLLQYSGCQASNSGLAGLNLRRRRENRRQNPVVLDIPLETPHHIRRGKKVYTQEMVSFIIAVASRTWGIRENNDINCGRQWRARR